MVQPETEPQEGISTSPSILRPTQVLCTHQQNMVDYVHLMVEAGMNLPMWEDELVPLVTEVFLCSFFFFLLLTLVFIPFLILFFIHLSMFPLLLQVFRKSIWLITFIAWQSYCNTDALQQLEVALLGSRGSKSD